MDATTRIKNLSIALEALSRIPDSRHLSYRIEDALKVVLTELEEENQKPIPPARPAIPTPFSTDNDIPF